MPIPFACPHCGHQVMVADQYIGQTGPCARCGQSVTITSTPSFAAGGPQTKKGGGSSMGLVLGIIGGIALLAVLTCGGLGFFVFRASSTAVMSARSAAGRAQSMNNLKQIALAMHNYNDVHGSFPPAYLPDANGQPMHSWRVLILPYLDQAALYQQYRFDEPWNGPNNSQLAQMMPMPYQSFDGSLAAPLTRYVVLAGPGTMFEGSQAVKMQEVTDGLSLTLLAVETTTPTHWMAPTDLDVSEMSFAINDPARPAIGNSGQEGGANVSTADGAVRFVTPADTSPETLKGMSTRAGGEAVQY